MDKGTLMEVSRVANLWLWECRPSPVRFKVGCPSSVFTVPFPDPSLIGSQQIHWHIWGLAALGP